MPITECPESEASAPAANQREPRPLRDFIELLAGDPPDKNRQRDKAGAAPDLGPAPDFSFDGEENPEGASVEQAPVRERLVIEEVLVREKNGSTLSLTDQGESTDDRLMGYMKERGTMAADLDLSATNISDKGLEALRLAPQLNSILLADTAITDAGLETIFQQKLLKLREVNLHSTTIGDKGAATLSKITSLQKLNLMDTNVSDEGAAKLSKMRNLQILNLDYSAVGNEGVKALKDTQNLRSLSLKGCPITDDCVRDLAQFKNLMVLNLEDTQLSQERVEWLQRMMPRCVITTPEYSGPTQGIRLFRRPF